MNFFVHNVSVIGGLLIVCGLYMFLWGKSKEVRKVNKTVSSEITQKHEATEVVVMSTTTKSDDITSTKPNNTVANVS